MLESGVFGSWTPPDYYALARANAAEYAALRAAGSSSGGTAASPAAAALAPPPIRQRAEPVAAADGEGGHGQGTPPAARSAEGRHGSLNGSQPTGTGVPLSPPTSAAQIAVEQRVADWLERKLLPAINTQESLAPRGTWRGTSWALNFEVASCDAGSGRLGYHAGRPHAQTSSQGSQR